jgi:hypothetical protein
MAAKEAIVNVSGIAKAIAIGAFYPSLVPIMIPIRTPMATDRNVVNDSASVSALRIPQEML